MAMSFENISKITTKNEAATLQNMLKALTVFMTMKQVADNVEEQVRLKGDKDTQAQIEAITEKNKTAIDFLRAKEQFDIDTNDKVMNSVTYQRIHAYLLTLNLHDAAKNLNQEDIKTVTPPANDKPAESYSSDINKNFKATADAGIKLMIAQLNNTPWKNAEIATLAFTMAAFATVVVTGFVSPTFYIKMYEGMLSVAPVPFAVSLVLMAATVTLIFAATYTLLNHYALKKAHMSMVDGKVAEVNTSVKNKYAVNQPKAEEKSVAATGPVVAATTAATTVAAPAAKKVTFNIEDDILDTTTAAAPQVGAPVVAPLQKEATPPVAAVVAPVITAPVVAAVVAPVTTVVAEPAPTAPVATTPATTTTAAPVATTPVTAATVTPATTSAFKRFMQAIPKPTFKRTAAETTQPVVAGEPASKAAVAALVPTTARVGAVTTTAATPVAVETEIPTGTSLKDRVKKAIPTFARKKVTAVTTTSVPVAQSIEMTSVTSAASIVADSNTGVSDKGAPDVAPLQAAQTEPEDFDNNNNNIRPVADFVIQDEVIAGADVAHKGTPDVAPLLTASEKNASNNGAAVQLVEVSLTEQHREQIVLADKSEDTDLKTSSSSATSRFTSFSMPAWMKKKPEISMPAIFKPKPKDEAKKSLLNNVT